MKHKYIDAEKLKSIIKAHLKERKEWMKDPDRSDRQDQLWSDLNGEDVTILQIINSLQQEQSEVDLEKEIKRYLQEEYDRDTTVGDVARHFYELEKQKYCWKPTETDVALFNKAVTTNKALTPAERAQLDIIRAKFGYCRATNCSGIVEKEQEPIPSREMILGIWELGNFWKENPEARNGLTQLKYIQKYWNEKSDYQKE